MGLSWVTDQNTVLYNRLQAGLAKKLTKNMSSLLAIQSSELHHKHFPQYFPYILKESGDHTLEKLDDTVGFVGFGRSAGNWYIWNIPLSPAIVTL